MYVYVCVTKKNQKNNKIAIQRPSPFVYIYALQN